MKLSDYEAESAALHVLGWEPFDDSEAVVRDALTRGRLIEITADGSHNSTYYRPLIREGNGMPMLLVGRDYKRAILAQIIERDSTLNTHYRLA